MVDDEERPLVKLANYMCKRESPLTENLFTSINGTIEIELSGEPHTVEDVNELLTLHKAGLFDIFSELRVTYHIGSDEMKQLLVAFDPLINESEQLMKTDEGYFWGNIKISSIAQLNELATIYKTPELISLVENITKGKVKWESK